MNGSRDVSGHKRSRRELEGNPRRRRHGQGSRQPRSPVGGVPRRELSPYRSLACGSGRHRRVDLSRPGRSPSCTVRVVLAVMHPSSASKRQRRCTSRVVHLAVEQDPDWDEQAYVTSERSRVTMSCVLRYCDRRQHVVPAVPAEPRPAVCGGVVARQPAPDLDYRPTAFCDSERCGGRLVGAVQTWKPAK